MLYFTVIPVRLNILLYGIRDNVFYRPFFLYLLPDVGGRNMQQRRVQYPDICPISIFNFKPRPAVHNKGVTGNQLLKILPPVYVLEAVSPHDHRETLQRKFFREVGKRIYGIRWLGKGKLHITGPELGIVLYGYVHQVQPVIFIKQAVRVFQRIVR